MLPFQSNHAIDELLVSYLLGEATEVQQRSALKWISASPENERYFQEFQQIWEKSRELAANSSVDVNAAWERMREKLEKGKNGGKEEGKTGRREDGKVVSLAGWWRRAAAILAIVVTGTVGWTIYRQWTNAGWMELASQETTLQQLLPDSSKITLNKGATIEYPKQFARNKRRIKLKGEAFFDVKRIPEQPFEVEVNQLTVTVLGTSFNIRETDSVTVVIVETGTVQVSDGNQSIVLHAGEQIIAGKNLRSWTKVQQTDKLYQYYRTRTFNCDRTPLWKLVEVLNEAYDSNIVIINPAIRELPITTVFENQPLDEVLSIIAQTLDITITRKADQIYVE
ncbi:FecR domain-containing protein [Flavihumibacter cheonanensis]|uniref:FecR family protein n=1 Tax=Flavihumibacter cheonanensis TaxID=1442385 RepID=UPI001EF9B387|nr:FecR domain-containing protein [Flavihumibacter cheonanensis]MCG7751973.1 FecR domain-containing protein [Flavihumibacter cheonanensis]